MAAVDMRHVNFWLPADCRPNTQRAAPKKNHRGSVVTASSRNQTVPLYSKAGSRLPHCGISRSAVVVTQTHGFSNHPVGDGDKTQGTCEAKFLGDTI